MVTHHYLGGDGGYAIIQSSCYAQQDTLALHLYVACVRVP